MVNNMVDVFSEVKRKWLMGRIKGRDTKPEIFIRSIIHRMGFRFRLQRRDLPGCPDIVLPRYKKVIFVNGCFWHGHEKCLRAKRPTTNIDFWNKKLDKNIKRDKKIRNELKKIGWKALVIWQCEIKKPATIYRKLERFLRESCVE